MTELNFKGKEFVYNHHLAVPFRPLVPNADRGIGPVALDGNLIIQGDNLHALKALLPLYAGKIDCIFIDPPYNTGNEGWCYNDSVNAPMIREWLESNPVGVEDGLRHDKWCAMMWPRLRLLYELLADDGIFLMHIDENELERASSMLDEIFSRDPDNPGKTNRLGSLVWDKRNPKGDAQGISYQHEFIIVAAKNRSLALKRRPLVRTKLNAEKMIEAGARFFKKVDSSDVPSDLAEVLKKYDLDIDIEHLRKIYDRDAAAEEYAAWVSRQADISGGERPYNKLDSDGNVYRLVHMGWPNKKKAPDDYFKPIEHPVTGKECPTPERGWRYPSDTIIEMLGSEEVVEEPLGYIRKGEIVFGRDESVQPQRKYLLKDHGNENIPSILRFGGSDDELLASLEINFENAKPHRFISDVLRWITLPQDVILDSFAGSGTIGHAALLANSLDGGERKFILVQMDEGEGKANADHTTAERLRKVIEGVDGLKADTLGLGGEFTFCDLGDPVELDKVLSGETLPSFDGIGSVLFHMATARAFDPSAMREDGFYLGATEGQHVWLIYKPDLDWLKSPEAALTLKRAKEFAATDPEARHLVFAPARYVSQKMLAEQNIPVEFVPLPFALYRIDRS